MKTKNADIKINKVKSVKKESIKKFLHLILFFTFSLSSFSQTEEFISRIEFQGDQIQKNDAANPCITLMEYKIIEKRCAENVLLLNSNRRQKKNTLLTRLNWPLQPAVGFTDCSYYYIGAYVDQNTTTGAISDWNCGIRTYDGHNGTDLCIWPFPFNKVDNNSIEVIAAAPGTIIDKHDGEFDRNCSTVGTTLRANYIIIEHADGSKAIYAHVKKNSITSKSIGQTVVEGEYLAVVASSGHSQGPHLHFEVWAGNTLSTRIDPYSGTCNLLNNSSWWASQKSYYEPAILKASVHITNYIPATCPNSDSIYECTRYVLPFNGPKLTTNHAKFYIFCRDVTKGSVVDLKIFNQNGTTINNWSYTFPGNYPMSSFGWSKHLPTIPGIYTFQANYNGISCSQNFTVSILTSISESDKFQGVKIYPNPSNNQFTISFPTDGAEISVTNTLGQQIMKAQAKHKEFTLQLTESGVYIVWVKTKLGVTRKTIINR